MNDSNKHSRQLIIKMAKKYVKSGTGSSVALLESRTSMHPIPNLGQYIKQSSYLIVGGVATRLYMPERTTHDLAILTRSLDSQITYQELSLSGCVKVSDLCIPGTHWRLPDGSELDVIESSDEWVEFALKEPNYNADNQPVIKLKYLVLMKLLAGRTQDIADISRMLGGATDSDLIQVRTTMQSYLPTALEDLESLITLGKLERP